MPATKKSTTKKESQTSSPVSRADDGTVQITLTLPWSEVSHEMEHAVSHIAETKEIPGFRKGKAPINEIKKRVSREEILEHALGHMLPHYFGEAIKTHNLNPITYPKFEIISTEDEKDWQIRAIIAEMPEINLGDYKKEISAASTISSLKNKEQKELSREEKEQMAINTLLENIKFEAPKMLVDEEVENRLSQLLARLEKLGVSIESYLASTQKNFESLREEYVSQAQTAIKLELILSKLIDEEKIDANEDEITTFIKAAGDAKLEEELSKPESKLRIGAIIKKRKVIDSLVSLIS